MQRRNVFVRTQTPHLRVAQTANAALCVFRRPICKWDVRSRVFDLVYVLQLFTSVVRHMAEIFAGTPTTIYQQVSCCAYHIHQARHKLCVYGHTAWKCFCQFPGKAGLGTICLVCCNIGKVCWTCTWHHVSWSHLRKACCLANMASLVIWYIPLHCSHTKNLYLWISVVTFFVHVESCCIFALSQFC